MERCGGGQEGLRLGRNRVAEDGRSSSDGRSQDLPRRRRSARSARRSRCREGDRRYLPAARRCGREVRSEEPGAGSVLRRGMHHFAGWDRPVSAGTRAGVHRFSRPERQALEPAGHGTRRVQRRQHDPDGRGHLSQRAGPGDRDSETCDEGRPGHHHARGGCPRPDRRGVRPLQDCGRRPERNRRVRDGGVEHQQAAHLSVQRRPRSAGCHRDRRRDPWRGGLAPRETLLLLHGHAAATPLSRAEHGAHLPLRRERDSALPLHHQRRRSRRSDHHRWKPGPLSGYGSGGTRARTASGKGLLLHLRLGPRLHRSCQRRDGRSPGDAAGRDGQEPGPAQAGHAALRRRRRRRCRKKGVRQLQRLCGDGEHAAHRLQPAGLLLVSRLHRLAHDVLTPGASLLQRTGRLATSRMERDPRR